MKSVQFSVLLFLVEVDPPALAGSGAGERRPHAQSPYHNVNCVGTLIHTNTTQPKELDDDRIVDYSLNPGKPVGVSLHAVSEGVKLEGLPQPEKVRSILGGLGVRVV